MAEKKEAEIIKADANIGGLVAQGVGASFCSINADPNDRKAASKVFNALNNPDHRVADFINKKIAVKDVLVEISEVVNESTGEIETAPRVVLIDDKGEAYQSVSVGMFGAVKNAIKVFGQPTWEPPLDVIIKQKPVGKGSMLTFDIG